MRDYAEFIAYYERMRKIAEERAERIMKITGQGFGSATEFESVEFDEIGVEFVLLDSRYDLRDTRRLHLPLSVIEMSEHAFAEHLEELRKQVEDKKKQTKDKQASEARKSRLALYEKLKREFGETQ